MNEETTVLESPNFIPYARQSIDDSDREEVMKAMSGSFLTRGPYVQAFEQAIADYCGAQYAVAFNSASTGLTAACHVGKIQPGDRFLTTPNSFVISSGAASLRNVSPIFIDIERQSGNLSLDQLAYNVNQPISRGKNVVLPVHFAGIPVDMKKLDQMIKNPETLIIEDAAHALGSRYPTGEKVGCCTWSAMAVLSFHPAKNLTTGEGGMVLTNDPDLDARLRRFRNNGMKKTAEILKEMPWYYEVEEITGNFHMTEMQAALGLSQLKRLDSFIKRRQKLVSLYRELLKNTPYITFFSPKHDAYSAYHLFVVQIDFKAIKKTRAEVMQKLYEDGIGTQVHYIPIYKHPIYKSSLGDISEYFPEMEAYYSEALSLPLYVDLSEEQIQKVCYSLKKILGLKA